MNGKRNEDRGDKIKPLLVDGEKQFLEALGQRLEFREFAVAPVNNGRKR
jgi:hypothetical protein